ncbi:MAG: hypothetical protein RIR59_638 [Pseudomonadota bacterium]|jgi:hypothetical protein
MNFAADVHIPTIKASAEGQCVGLKGALERHIDCCVLRKWPSFVSGHCTPNS